MLSSGQNYKKNALFWQFEDHNSWRDSETRQMPSFFSCIFQLTVYNIHYCIWKYSTFIFMGSPPCSILDCKIPQFRAKATIRTHHHFFLESRHAGVNKNPYCVLFPWGSQEKVSTHVLILLILSMTFPIHDFATYVPKEQLSFDLKNAY